MAVLALAFMRINVPAIRRDHDQHLACGGGGEAQGLLIGGNAGALGRHGKAVAFGKGAGEERLVAVSQRGRGGPHRRPLGRQHDIGIGPARRCGFHGNLLPVRAQFPRGNLWQKGRNTLPHFKLRHRNGHDPVLADLQPWPEGELALVRFKREGKASRRGGIGDDEAAACQRADQKPPPRDHY